MALLLCHSEAAQFAAKNPYRPLRGSSTEAHGNDRDSSLHSEWQNQVPISNIRSNATLDQYFTWSATRMRLTTLPSTRFSSGTQDAQSPEFPDISRAHCRRAPVENADVPSNVLSRESLWPRADDPVSVRH